MVGGLRPLRPVKRLQPSNQARAINDEPVKAYIEIHLQQEIISVLIAGQVRLNHWRGIRQHVLEPIKKDGMHMREMTRVFVR